MAKSILDRYEDAHTVFLSGNIESQTDEQLLTHLSGLANQNNINTGTQHRDIIRGLTVNNILLKRHIDRLQTHITALNTQNSRTQLLVIALTVASLLGTAAQIWYAYRSDAKEAQEAVISATPSQPASVSRQSSPTNSASVALSSAPPKQPMPSR